MKFKITVLFFLVNIILVSCGNYFTFDSIRFIRYDISHKEFVRLTESDFYEIFNFNVDGKEYQIYWAYLVNKIMEYRTYFGTESRTSMYVAYEKYYFTFKNEKLLYWGYPHEYARSGDSVLMELHNIYYEIEFGS